MRSQKVKLYFNMVEIVLAISILAFGFASVLGMFPVAIKAVRNSQAESVATDAVSDIHAYFCSLARVPMIDYNNSDTTKRRTILDDGYVYAALFYNKPVSGDPKDFKSLISYNEVKSLYELYLDMEFYEVDVSGADDIEDFRNKLRNPVITEMYHGEHFLKEFKTKLGTIDRSTKDVQDELFKDSDLRYIKNINLFQPENNHNPNFVYFYLVNADEEFYNINFTAQILVWKSPIEKIYEYGESHSPLTSYKDAVALNFEVSWPINVPYDQREKRYYQTIITNPQ